MFPTKFNANKTKRIRTYETTPAQHRQQHRFMLKGWLLGTKTMLGYWYTAKYMRPTTMAKFAMIYVLIAQIIESEFSVLINQSNDPQ